MKPGYSGKILSINLTDRTTSVLHTEMYEEFVGGNGIGTAIFWDRCKDKTISGFDPENIVTVMPGPLAGTMTPGASRTEICGINVFSYPVEWFSRSNIGGFFASMLKYAGWDGIVIEGKATSPVWVHILNDSVTIKDAKSLWGMCTRSTQHEIWRRVTGRESFGDWFPFSDTQTTQGPSILCIGPGGETLSRMGTIQTGGGMSAGQGGFGGVWGSKKLKAISVIGTGSIKVADPKALLAARKRLSSIIEQKPGIIEEGRQTSCPGCFQKCKSRVRGGTLQDAMCLGTINMTDVLDDDRAGSDIIQMYGLNMNDMTGLAITDGVYIHKLYKMGVLGPNKAIDSSPLPMEKFGGAEFTESLCKAIVNREGIGADLAEGLMRSSKKWGRLERDLETGLLNKAQWGYGWHWSVPFVEQGFGSLMSERDLNKHGFSMNRLWADVKWIGPDILSAEKFVEMLSQKMIPYTDDPLMLDFNWQGPDGGNIDQALATGIYSKHKAKLVAWHQHYTRFWIESMLYCDHMWPVFFSAKTGDLKGITPEMEPTFYKAVTGQNLSFAEGMEKGRKIWNLNRAIWALQGRHRDMEGFAGFMYTPAGNLIEHLRLFKPPPPPKKIKHESPTGGSPPSRPRPRRRRPRHSFEMTILENGKWRTADLGDMYLDKDGVEHWKTKYYEFEGWDPETGRPTRNTLEELGLKNVADTLDRSGKLGSPR